MSFPFMINGDYFSFILWIFRMGWIQTIALDLKVSFLLSSPSTWEIPSVRRIYLEPILGKWQQSVSCCQNSGTVLDPVMDAKVPSRLGKESCEWKTVSVSDPVLGTGQLIPVLLKVFTVGGEKIQGFFYSLQMMLGKLKNIIQMGLRIFVSKCVSVNLRTMHNATCNYST